MRMDLIKCELCDQEFVKKSNLYRHVRNSHNVEPVKDTLCATTCGFEGCDKTFCHLKALKEHVASVHALPLVETALKFSNLEDFNHWLDKEEKNTLSKFIRLGGKKELKQGDTRQTLACHRSGVFSPRGTNRRQTKGQGSNKIGFTCTASIVTTRHPDGSLDVAYCNTHYGHDFSLRRVRLSKTERESIAARVAQGISVSNILRDIRESWDSEADVRRIHLTSRKDVRNICRRYGISRPLEEKNPAKEGDRQSPEPAKTLIKKKLEDVGIKVSESSRIEEDFYRGIDAHLEGVLNLLELNAAGATASTTEDSAGLQSQNCNREKRCLSVKTKSTKKTCLEKPDEAQTK